MVFIKRVYDVFKEAMKSTEGFHFKDGEEDKQYEVLYQIVDDTIPESISVCTYPSADDVKALSNITMSEFIKIHIQVQCAGTEESAFRAITFLRNLCPILESIRGNKGNGLRILGIEHIGNRGLVINFNETGHIAVANYSVKYKLD